MYYQAFIFVSTIIIIIIIIIIIRVICTSDNVIIRIVCTNYSYKLLLHE